MGVDVNVVSAVWCVEVGVGLDSPLLGGWRVVLVMLGAWGLWCWWYGRGKGGGEKGGGEKGACEVMWWWMVCRGKRVSKDKAYIHPSHPLPYL